MVGRQAPYAVLTEALDAVCASGEGRVAIVVGEPGIGKSRLLAELRSRVRDRNQAAWAEGQARSYAQDVPDHLLIGLVGSLVAAAPATPVDAAIAHLLGRIDVPGTVELDRLAPEMRRGRYMTAI